MAQESPKKGLFPMGSFFFFFFFFFFLSFLFVSLFVLTVMVFVVFVCVFLKIWPSLNQYLHKMLPPK